MQLISLPGCILGRIRGVAQRGSRGVSKSDELDIMTNYINSINVSHNFKIVSYHVRHFCLAQCPRCLLLNHYLVGKC